MKLGIVMVTCRGRNREWVNEAVNTTAHVADQFELVECGVDEATYPATTVTLQPDRGIAYASNLGVSRLKTDWVMMMDDDNLGIPGALERLKHMAGDAYQGPVIATRVVLFGLASGLYGMPLIRSELKKMNHIACCSWFRYSAWEQVGGFEIQHYMDYHFWCKLSDAGVHFDYHSEPIVQARIYAESATGILTPEEREKAHRLSTMT